MFNSEIFSLLAISLSFLYRHSWKLFFPPAPKARVEKMLFFSLFYFSIENNTLTRFLVFTVTFCSFFSVWLYAIGSKHTQKKNKNYEKKNKNIISSNKKKFRKMERKVNIKDSFGNTIHSDFIETFVSI